MSTLEIQPAHQSRPLSFSYESIGMGGLALHSRHAFGWISRLADELVLIAYNSRPDITFPEAQLLISLRTSKELLTLTNGKTIYLKEALEGRGLSFSDEVTGLWVKPFLLENGSLFVESGRKLISKEGHWGEEKGEFVLFPQGGIPSRYNPVLQVFIKELKSARAFSQDLLVQKYGGKEYVDWREKIALEFLTASSTYACFVSKGDYLLYDGGEWRVVSYEKLVNDRPIAYVKSVSANGVEIEAWDETGFYPVSVKLEMEKPHRFQPKLETVPSGVRLKGGNAVSCAFGKRRMILKQGDWLLKTQTGWRHLKKAEEISQYLHHRLKGELFIFDSIEKEQGRQVIKGHLFDETRTQVQPIIVPIEGDKSSGKISRKRKSSSSHCERRVI